MIQEEMGKAILKIQENTIGIQNTLIKMQQDQKERNKVVDARFDKMDARMDEMDARMDKMDARMDKMDARLDKMDARMDKMDARLDDMDKKFVKTNKEIIDIVNDVSDTTHFILNKLDEKLGNTKNEKLKSKSHMQILENHEDRISTLESKKVANQ